MAYTKVSDQWVWKGQNGQEARILDVVGSQPTPFYLYDLDDIADRVEKFRTFSTLPIHLHYAMKANCNNAILKVIRDLGLGLDVVSGGEMARAMELGFKPADIVFSGVGKTEKEITTAITNSISQINVESLSELKRILKIAKSMGKTAAVAFRLNPDVEAVTHPYIQTGFRENKFGVDEALLPEFLDVVRASAGVLQLKGLTLHIGSQIRDLESFKAAFLKAKKVFHNISKEFPLSTFDIGGGLGVDYTREGTADFGPLKDYLAVVAETLGDLKNVKILAEPGRILVARSGILVTRVEYIKETPFKKFAIVDTGMHQLMRPALYQAFHRIEKLKPSGDTSAVYDIVGPICESTDVLAKSRSLERLDEGDRLLIFDAGAYGAVMANNYNLHDDAKEFVIVDGKLKEAL